MADITEIFEQFGKIYSIELSVTIDPKQRSGEGPPHCNGWALITYLSYESAQRALFAHLTRRIPGMCTPISIYKGCCSNIVLLKNIPSFLSKADVLSRINEYQGLVSISFLGGTTAKMTFEDLDYALLFMDLVSSGGLVIEGYTCTVEIEDMDESDDDSDN
jgi:RNA recognition motif-containing protein